MQKKCGQLLAVLIYLHVMDLRPSQALDFPGQVGGGEGIPYHVLVEFTVVDGPAEASVLLGHVDDGASPGGLGEVNDVVMQPGVNLLLEAGIQGGLDVADWGADGVLGQVNVHLDQLGVPDGNVLIG